MNTFFRLLDNSAMKLPRTAIALAILATMLAAQTAPSSVANKKASPTKQGKAPKKPSSAESAKARKGSIGKTASDTMNASLNRKAMSGVVDSLLGSANQRRLDENAQRALDSSRRASDSIQRLTDSVQRVADSVRRVDSTLSAQRTWHVAIGLPAPSTGYAKRLRDRLEIELRRTGRISVRTSLDTSASADAIWSTARASGAGKLLVVSIASDSQGRMSSMARLFDVARGEQLDSAWSESPDTSAPQTRNLANRLVRSILPSSRDSACRIDSLRKAGAIWVVPVASSEIRDTLPARSVRDSLLATLRRSPWASPGSTTIPDSCRSPICLDSLSKASGASLALRTRLARQSDSSWMLAAKVLRLADSVVVESILVTDAEAGRLAGRIAAELLTPPPSCQVPCLPASSRSVWTTLVVGDSSSLKHASSLSPLFTVAFRSHSDRQFLSIPSGFDRVRFDSAARSLGATKRAAARISGNDSLWTMSVEILDLRNARIDTLVLKRGGPRTRIFPWFARHLASWGARDEICRSACRLDSAGRSNANWAVMPDPDTNATHVRNALAKAFREHGIGRFDSISVLPGCNEPRCVDSLAWSRSIARTVWPVFARGRDSAWNLRVKIADMASDTWTDSVIFRDTGDAENVLARSSRMFWNIANPVRSCDSCVSTDTLEAALAIALPPAWIGAPDSLRAAFRDTLARILFEEGRYQILDTAKFSGLIGDSTSYRNLRCRTGAAFLLRSELTLGKAGWFVKASLLETTTNRVVASLEYQDKNRRPDRPTTLAPWVARRLLGTETRTEAPSPGWDLPWRKIAKLGIPAVIGITSVLLHQ